MRTSAVLASQSPPSPAEGSESDRDAIIVGAGPAGLACAAMMRAAGLAPLILEKDDDIAAAWRRHYDCLHLHTERAFSGLPGLPMTRSYPRFPSREQVIEYLEAYAAKFAIRPIYRIKVRSITRKGAIWAVDCGARTLNAPVVMTRNGRGSLSDRHPMALGPLGLNPALAATDAALVVGSRLAGPSGRSPALPDGAALITVNADPADARRDNRATLAVVADARAFLGAVIAELDSKPQADTSARWLVERIRLEEDKHLAGLEPQMEYVRVLRSAIPDDGVLVNELTQVGYVAGLGYPVWQAGTFITPGYEGTLGYGFPTALGVKAADPRRAVVSITGDGGFGWSLQELATARRYGIGVVTVLFNNDAFANVRRTQLEEFGGRVLGSELTNPDFVALAESFGVHGTRVDGPAELAGALREAIAGTDPVLIEVPLPECPSPWALIQRGIPANP